MPSSSQQTQCELRDNHQRMILTGADRGAFLDAVLNPPEPAPKLVKALRRHRKLMS